MYLVRRGVPYDVAFELEDAERMAYVVALGELEGGKFDWRRLRWEEGVGGRVD